MMNHIKLLESKYACFKAVKWAKDYPSFESAWNACHRSDWMLWIAKKLNVDKRKLTLAKGKCAETVIHLMKDQRSIDAVKAAIAYGNGEIDDVQLKIAADAADVVDVAYAAYAAARKENQRKTADICREILTDEILTASGHNE